MAKAKPQVVVKYKPYPVYPFPGLRALRSKLSAKRVLDYNAYTHGMNGGFNGWTVAFLLLYIVRRSMKNRGPQLVARDVLKPGEGLVIRTITPPTRADRKAAHGAR